MTASIEQNFGLSHSWDLGEDDWNVGMDANLLKLSRVGVHLSVIDRDIADPSTITPSEGDRFIVASSGVGEWSGQDENLAVFNGSDGWVFYEPSLGWLAYIEDEEVLSVYKSTSNGGWSAGVSI